MLAVRCPDVATRSGLVLVPEEHIVAMDSDGAGRIVLRVRCWRGHEHQLVTGRAAKREASGL